MRRERRIVSFDRDTFEKVDLVDALLLRGKARAAGARLLLAINRK